VSEGAGTPFLAATQVFDARPVPRKWLAIERTDEAKIRFARPGTMLVTRSGSVGRPVLAHAAHQGALISDDLLRVDPIDERQRGWIYAYLHAPQTRAMATGAHYGHMIKHLEASHLSALPVPEVGSDTAAQLSQDLSRILDLRSQGYHLTLDAEARFEKALGPVRASGRGEAGFEVKATDALMRGRRRFEASAHNPVAMRIRRHLAKVGRGLTTVSDAGFDVWVPGRYKRIPAEDGVTYFDSADLLEVCPDLSKRYADCRFGDDHRGRVRAGWILVPCSGQVYGIIGTAVLATKALDAQVVSNHVMRIVPGPKAEVRVGYLVTALSHPTLGRPLIKSLAFGSSVPELDPADVASFAVVRLPAKEEEAIADLAEAAATAYAEADLTERSMAEKASAIIDRFLSAAGDAPRGTKIWDAVLAAEPIDPN